MLRTTAVVLLGKLISAAGLTTLAWQIMGVWRRSRLARRVIVLLTVVRVDLFRLRGTPSLSNGVGIRAVECVSRLSVVVSRRAVPDDRVVLWAVLFSASGSLSFVTPFTLLTIASTDLVADGSSTVSLSMSTSLGYSSTESLVWRTNPSSFFPVFHHEMTGCGLPPALLQVTWTYEPSFTGPKLPPLTAWPLHDSVGPPGGTGMELK